jgi:hypothetical protein
MVPPVVIGSLLGGLGGAIIGLISQILPFDLETEVKIRFGEVASLMVCYMTVIGILIFVFQIFELAE